MRRCCAARARAWRSEPISDVRARDLIASGVVDVRPRARGGWQIRPGRWVGAARVGDPEVHIDPKMPIGRLLFLLGYLADPKAWHDEPVRLEVADDLPRRPRRRCPGRSTPRCAAGSCRAT